MRTKTTADLKRQKLIAETELICLQIEEMNRRQCDGYVATAYFSDGTSRHVRGGAGMFEDTASADRIEALEDMLAKSERARESLNAACDKLGVENYDLKNQVHAISKGRDDAQEVARYRGAILDVHAFKFHKYSFDNQ